jgi:succinate dehydrogenase / fumarate reductase membrane anchor subunit
MLLKWEPGGMKSEIARARGLGSARDGVKHWLHQRMSAIANLPLMLWLGFALADLIQRGPDYNSAVQWLQSGLNPVLMILTILSVCYHAKLGLQIVIEDYVHHEGRKLALLMFTKMGLGALVVACLFAVLKITL